METGANATDPFERIVKLVQPDRVRRGRELHLAADIYSMLVRGCLLVLEKDRFLDRHDLLEDAFKPCLFPRNSCRGISEFFIYMNATTREPKLPEGRMICAPQQQTFVIVKNQKIDAKDRQERNNVFVDGFRDVHGSFW